MHVYLYIEDAQLTVTGSALPEHTCRAGSLISCNSMLLGAAAMAEHLARKTLPQREFDAALI